MTSLGQYWADWIIEECVRQGITNVGVAPGARSAALVIAAAKHPSLTTCVHFDERALGFWALGYAKASGRPAIVITTSGTAVANLLPAVVEASQSSTPLIILSADRPHELHDIGANQTITQEGIFGNYVRWSTTLPSPTSEISPLYLLSTMDYAVFKATQIHPGPVQINCMFREPLLAGQNLLDGYEKCLEKWQVSSSPFTTYPRFKAGLDPAQIERCNELLSNSKSGCFIVGSMSKDDAQAVLQAAQRFHWPILAEGGSGLSVVDHPLVLDLTKMNNKQVYDVALVVGDPITLKSVMSVTHCRCKSWITIHPSPTRQDTFLHGGERIIAKPSDVLPLLSRVPTIASTTVLDSESVIPAEAVIQDRIVLTEQSAIYYITRSFTSNTRLFCGNSLAIRLLTTHAARALPSPQDTYVNRGASGIDGNIATIAGIQAHDPQPLVAILGDQTALHDLTSLKLIAALKPSTHIYVLNNYGGGIFADVLSSEANAQKDYFQAPHQLSFKQAAKQFNIPYVEIKSIQHLSEFLAHDTQTGPVLIEIICMPKENEKTHE